MQPLRLAPRAVQRIPDPAPAVTFPAKGPHVAQRHGAQFPRGPGRTYPTAAHRPASCARMPARRCRHFPPDEAGNVDIRPGKIGRGIKEIEQIGRAQDGMGGRRRVRVRQAGRCGVCQRSQHRSGRVQFRKRIRPGVLFPVNAFVQPEDAGILAFPGPVAAPEALHQRRPRRHIRKERGGGNIHARFHDLRCDDDAAFPRPGLPGPPAGRRPCRRGENGSAADRAAACPSFCAVSRTAPRHP